MTEIEVKGYKPAVVLHTSQYAGSVPIFSPTTGCPAGDLAITGRFGEDAGDIVSLLGDNVDIEFSDNLRLNLANRILPQQFIECIKYINLFPEAQRAKWRKFSNEFRYQSAPVGQTLWAKYAVESVLDPGKSLRFPNKRNILTTDHKEWRELNYVLSMCVKTLMSPEIPIAMRFQNNRNIESARHYLNTSTTMVTDRLAVHMSDPLVIRKLKECGNNILNHKSSCKMAWRVDYNKVFERYVYDIIEKVARRTSAKVVQSPHYNVYGNNIPKWAPAYLEPDMLYIVNGHQIPIDAKYKSHLLNWNEATDQLKSTFRHDLHQVIAYSNFRNIDEINTVLAYPSKEPFHREINYRSPYSPKAVRVHLVGISLEISKISQMVNDFVEILSMR
ncbi:MAG: hypothetical protein NC339_06735 [Muribaculaceae bacterium]|nr:hypothetical protein [Muribaculaceae bacterium]